MNNARHEILRIQGANEKVSYQEDFTLIFMFDLLTPETDIAVADEIHDGIDLVSIHII